MYKEYTRYALLVLLSVSLSGCAFFTVPKDVAEQVKFKPISLGCMSDSNDFNSFDKVYLAVRSDEEALWPVTKKSNPGYDIDDANYVFVDKFLHLSDTHIRDERIYAKGKWKKQLLAVDWVKDVTNRSPDIEKYDSLTFTAFLIGAAKLQQVADREFSFIVHTGDLLDISLSTELVESLQIMRAFTQKYPNLPIYSMAGNHDGLIWGNFPDKYPYLFDLFDIGYTHGLGINRTEFVLGHMLADPNLFRGFGFGSNEVLCRYRDEEDLKALKERIKKNKPKSKQKWFKLVRRQLDDIVDAVEKRSEIYKECDVELQLSIPAVFRKAIHTTGKGDKGGLKCGYYSWQHKVDQHKVKGINGIRYIALDTRSNWPLIGQMDDVQLGWLYNELAEALIGKECVIIFAHHHPDKIENSSFNTMLEKFPNIAAYFYGHSHPTDNYNPDRFGPNNFLLVQTPSLIDFPQTAREVEVYMSRQRNVNYGDSLDVRFRWRHVRPKGNELLEKKLNTCLEESVKDYEKPALLHLIEAHDNNVVSYEKWVYGNLSSDGNFVTIKFSKPSSMPCPNDIFDETQAEEIDDNRRILGLSTLMSKAPADCPDKKMQKDVKPKHTDNSNFGKVWSLPSAGLGICGMVRDKGRKQILLILGQPDDDLPTKIVQWSPESNEITPPEVKEASAEWSMEGIALGQAGQMYVVVDREASVAGKVLFPICKK